jgi:hypothetical protein
MDKWSDMSLTLSIWAIKIFFKSHMKHQRILLTSNRIYISSIVTLLIQLFYSINQTAIFAGNTNNILCIWFRYLYLLIYAHLNDLGMNYILCNMYRACISISIYHGIFCVQWFEVRGHCLFCWYWLNGWPSLFKLSFHNIIQFNKAWYQSNGDQLSIHFYNFNNKPIHVCVNIIEKSQDRCTNAVCDFRWMQPCGIYKNLKTWSMGQL